MRNFKSANVGHTHFFFIDTFDPYLNVMNIFDTYLNVMNIFDTYLIVDPYLSEMNLFSVYHLR